MLLLSPQKFRQLCGQLEPQKEKTYKEQMVDSHNWRRDKGIGTCASGSHLFTNMEPVDSNRKYEYG